LCRDDGLAMISVRITNRGVGTSASEATVGRDDRCERMFDWIDLSR
jgi:hypothetical protein